VGTVMGLHPFYVFMVILNDRRSNAIGPEAREEQMGVAFQVGLPLGMFDQLGGPSAEETLLAARELFKLLS
jgi:hypothetical protein